MSDKYDPNDTNWTSPFGFTDQLPPDADPKSPVCYKCRLKPAIESFPLFYIILKKILIIFFILSMILYAGRLATTCYDNANVARLIIACLFSPFYIIYIFVTMPDKCISAIPSFLR
tara:strand:+ start:319 stop:666 length:348 start_codon:yes stop_codon:yes gene_type:complete